MQRYKILHRTYYNFPSPVRLEPHVLRLRPREGYELHIESFTLEITPPATRLRWHRDVEDNSVAIATFNPIPTQQLLIESEVIIQQYNQAPLDFLVEDYATDYPFTYPPEDKAMLAPYMQMQHSANRQLSQWVATVWQPGERIQTYTLLQRLGLRRRSISAQPMPGLKYSCPVLAGRVSTPPSAHWWERITLLLP